mgnify:CR=1 FL=1
MDARVILDKVIELDKEIATLQNRFDELPTEDQAAALTTLFDNQLKSTGELDEDIRPFYRVVEMMSTIDGAALLLARGLSHSNEGVRHVCGDVLSHIAAEDGLAAIAPAVEHAIRMQDLSAREMPYILSLIEDPAAVAQIHRFLDSEDTEVVYQAIEACANLSDMDSLPPLRRLIDDDREIDIDDEEGPVTIGMLAREAIEIIESDEE